MVIIHGLLLWEKERQRLGVIDIQDVTNAQVAFAEAAAAEGIEYKRPKLLWVNFALTALLLVGLITAVMPLQILFMIGFAIAIMINYPNLEVQKSVSQHMLVMYLLLCLLYSQQAYSRVFYQVPKW